MFLKSLRSYGFFITLFLAISPNICWANTIVSIAAPEILKPTLNELANAWHTSQGGVATITYGDSHDQALEIELTTTPFDLFIDGDPENLRQTMSNGKGDARRPLATSSLVLITSKHEKPQKTITKTDFISQLGKGHLAICNPQTDVIGTASRGILNETGVWKEVQDNLILLPDTASVIQAVQAGEDRFGVVLRADLLNIPNIWEYGSFGDDINPEFTYFIITLTGHMRPEVKNFLAFLQSSEAVHIMTNHGFVAITHSD